MTFWQKQIGQSQGSSNVSSFTYALLFLNALRFFSLSFFYLAFYFDTTRKYLKIEKNQSISLQLKLLG